MAKPILQLTNKLPVLRLTEKPNKSDKKPTLQVTPNDYLNPQNINPSQMAKSIIAKKMA